MGIDFKPLEGPKPGEPGFSLTQVFEDLYTHFLKSTDQPLNYKEAYLKSALNRAFLAAIVYNLTLTQGRHEITTLNNLEQTRETQLLQIIIFMDTVMREEGNKRLDEMFQYLHQRLDVPEVECLTLLDAKRNALSVSYGNNKQYVLRTTEHGIIVNYENISEPIPESKKRMCLVLEWAKQLGYTKLDKRKHFDDDTRQDLLLQKLLLETNRIAKNTPTLATAAETNETVLFQKVLDQHIQMSATYGPNLMAFYQNGDARALDHIPNFVFKSEQPGFFFKTIRADEADFWRGFVHALVDLEPMEVRDLVSKRKGYASRLGESGEYEVMSTDKSDPTRKARWSAEVKAETTRAQSVSYANPSVDYIPPAFGHDNREILTGIVCPPQGIQRIMLYDNGTINRPYDSDSKKDATFFIEGKVQLGQYFTQLSALEEKGVGDQSNHNEIVARLKWVENDDQYKVAIFGDNPESRFLAQARAWDLYFAVQARRERKGLSTEGLRVPEIVFYPSMKVYSEKEQVTDLQTLESAMNPSLKRAILHFRGKTVLTLDEKLKMIQDKAWNKSRGAIFSRHFIREFMGKDFDAFLDQYLADPAAHANAFKLMAECMPPDLFKKIAMDETHPLHKHLIEKIFTTNIATFVRLLALLDPKEWKALMESNGIKSFMSGRRNPSPFFELLPPSQWALFLALPPFDEFSKNTGASPIPFAHSYRETKWEWIKTMLDVGVSPLCEIPNVGTLSHLAAQEGRFDIFMKCLEAGCDLHKKNDEGETPLSLLFKHEHLSIIKRLIERGLINDFNISSQEGNTLFHLAAAAGDDTLIDLLIEKCPTLINQTNTVGNTALLVALNHSQIAIAKTLIKAGADVTIVSNREQYEAKSALHKAMYANDLELVQLLVTHGASLTSLTKSSYEPQDELTPLTMAIYLHSPEKNRFAIIDYLIEQGADVHHCNSHGETPISIACHNGTAELVDHLLEKGADLNPKSGTSPLFGAIESRNDDMVDFLLKKNINTQVQNKENQSPFFFALVKKSYTQAMLLLPYETNRETNWLQVDIHQETALHKAAAAGQDALVEGILKHSTAMINAQDSNGYTALISAVYKHSFNSAKAIIAKGADVNLVNNDGYSALYWACNHDDEPMIDLLLEHKANVRWVNKEAKFRSPLCIACQYGRSKLIDRLVASGADLLEADSAGESPLVMIFCTRQIPLVKQVLKHIDKIPPAAPRGSSVLHYLSYYQDTDFFDLVVGKIEDFAEQINWRDRAGDTPLVSALSAHNLPYATYLLKKGADPNIPNSSGQSPLLQEVEKERPEVAMMLLDYPVDVNQGRSDKPGLTPLHYACQYGYTDLVLKLLSKGADPFTPYEQWDKKLITPLEMAIDYKHDDLVDAMIKARPGLLPVFVQWLGSKHASDLSKYVNLLSKVFKTIDLCTLAPLVTTESIFRRIFAQIPREYQATFISLINIDAIFTLNQSDASVRFRFMEFMKGLPASARSLMLERMGAHTFEKIFELDSNLSNLRIFLNIYEPSERLPVLKDVDKAYWLDKLTQFEFKQLLQCLPESSHEDFLNLIQERLAAILSTDGKIQNLVQDKPVPTSTFFLILNKLGMDHIKKVIDTRAQVAELYAALPDSKEELDNIFDADFIANITTYQDHQKVLATYVNEQDKVQYLKAIGQARLFGFLCPQDEPYLHGFNIKNFFAELSENSMVSMITWFGPEYIEKFKAVNAYELSAFPLSKQIAFLVALGSYDPSKLFQRIENPKNGAVLGEILRCLPDKKDIAPVLISAKLVLYDAFPDNDIKHLYVCMTKLPSDRKDALLDALNEIKLSEGGTKSMLDCLLETDKDNQNVRSWIVEILDEKSPWREKLQPSVNAASTHVPPPKK